MHLSAQDHSPALDGQAGTGQAGAGGLLAQDAVGFAVGGLQPTRPAERVSWAEGEGWKGEMAWDD